MHTPKPFHAIQIIALTIFVAVSGRGDTLPIADAGKLLPDRVGTFRAIAAPSPVEDQLEDFNPTSAALRDYQSSKGERLSVTIFKTTSDSSAYARLNNTLTQTSGNSVQELKIADVGTLGYVAPNAVTFFKGSAYVVVAGSGLPEYAGALLNFSTELAETLDKGEGEIPALVKHLPDWESAMARSLYAVNLQTLKNRFPGQPVLDAVSFDGSAEAVTAYYAPANLVIVEFNTPQIATENNSRITARIQELRNQGQTVPSSYRRVGNYAVFVFDAPDEPTANRLIDQVKYQQVVQWLGENPYLYEDAQREFMETTLGVFVNVVKGSGLALVSCGLVGGLLGALLFIRRRAQQREVQAYSDAGGMLRLNLDEMTPQTDPARLLGREHQARP
ncbi:MAG: DUF6599 family protein [Pyrinomonadaceae bacterium]